MNQFVCRFLLTAVATACLAPSARAVVVVAEDFFYNELTKSIVSLAPFNKQSYSGGQNGAGIWNQRWVSIGGTTIVGAGPDVTDPPFLENPHTAVVTEFATAASLQRSYIPSGAGASASTIYFAADFKVQDVSVNSLFAEFGIFSPLALAGEPTVSIGITDDPQPTGGPLLEEATFFGRIGSTVLTGNQAVPADLLVSDTTHRIVGKLEINAVPGGPTSGDFNADGFTDGADFLFWQARVATNTPAADPSGNGIVDGPDLTVWKENYGASALDRLTVYFDPTGVEQSNATVLTGTGAALGSVLDANVQRVASLNGFADTVDSGRPHFIDNLAIGTSWADVATVSIPRLRLEINSTSGQTRLVNNSAQAIDLTYYEILSESGALKPTGAGNWNSLDDQNASGGTWVENSPSVNQLIESNFSSSTTIAANGGFLDLGSAVNPAGSPTLVARWGTKQGAEGLLNLANVAYFTPVGAPVPEPASCCLMTLAALAGLGLRRRFAA